MDSLLSIEERMDKHFDELDAQAQTILQTATINGQTGDYIIPFDKFIGWATSVLVLLKQIFTEESIHFQHFQELCHGYQEYGYQFESARAIFLAAREDYDGGYIFNIRALVTAGVLAEALEQAKQLLNAGRKDAACVIASVVLGIALKELCARKSLVPHDLETMNAQLGKFGTYDSSKQKQIVGWIRLHTQAVYGDWNEYSEEDVIGMIDGVERFIAEYL